MRALRVLLMLGVAAASVRAQQPASPWLQETFQSAKLNEQRKIFIATPTNYNTSKQNYPVLVILDADDQPQFAAAVANVAFLASRGAIPDMLVVGIPNGKDRTHDMTPAAT